MKLTDSRIDVVMLPTRRPHKWSGLGPNVIGHYPIVRLTTSDGSEGFGEAPVLPTWGGDYGRYFGEDIQTTIHLVNDILFPTLKGKEPSNIPELLKLMDKVMVGYPYAKAAIDCALYDLLGKSQGRPIHDILGGKKREKILVSHSLGLMDATSSAKEAKRAVNEGIKAIKIKIGRGTTIDSHVVSSVREAVGESITLGVDANCGYNNVEDALKTVGFLEKLDVAYIEQPVEGIKNLLAVAKKTNIPIVADESAWTLDDVNDICILRAARGISVYTTKPGGLFRARKILTFCAEKSLLCNINGSCETGVGNAANIHLGVSAEKLELPCVVPVTNIMGKEQTRTAGVFYTDDIIEEPFEFKGGFIYPPKGNGLGVVVSDKKLEKYRSQFVPRPIVNSESNRIR